MTSVGLARRRRRRRRGCRELGEEKKKDYMYANAPLPSLHIIKSSFSPHSSSSLFSWEKVLLLLLRELSDDLSLSLLQHFSLCSEFPERRRRRRKLLGSSSLSLGTRTKSARPVTGWSCQGHQTPKCHACRVFGLFWKPCRREVIYQDGWESKSKCCSVFLLPFFGTIEKLPCRYGDGQNYLYQEGVAEW